MKNIVLRTFIVVFSIIVTTGCATKTKPLENDSTITSVSINKEVSVPERLNYVGNSVSLGLIGVLVAGDKKEKEWKAHAKENEIKIDDIVFEAFESEMESSKRFPLENNAKTKVTIDIVSYGLTVPNGLSKKLHPTLLVKTIITDEAGKIIWEHIENYAAFSKGSPLIEKTKLKEMPELLEEMWITAAVEVAKQTISKI